MRSLTTAGYKVLQAANGEEAIEISTKNSGVIHLLVSDIVMPVMGGAALVEELRRMRPNTKVLYTSGYADPKLFEQLGYVVQSATFLPKPFTREALLTKVRQVLDRV